MEYGWNDFRLHEIVGREQRILGAAILGAGGDEAIYGILDLMSATVSELIPTLIGEMQPA